MSRRAQTLKGDEGPDWKGTLALEDHGRELVRLVQLFGDSPDVTSQEFAHRLLIDIDAFYGPLSLRPTQNRAIIGFEGFGASVEEETGMRRAKVASSVLRFLYQDEWGVADWRTLGIRSALRRLGSDIDKPS